MLLAVLLSQQTHRAPMLHGLEQGDLLQVVEALACGDLRCSFASLVGRLGLVREGASLGGEGLESVGVWHSRLTP